MAHKGLLPPVSELAERFVTGALLTVDFARDQIFERVNESDFYFHQHSRVVRVVAELHRARKPVTVVSVAEVLQQRGEIVNNEGVMELVSIAESCGVGAGWEHFAEIVWNTSLKRRLLRFFAEVCRDLHDDSDAIETVRRVAGEMYQAEVGKRQNQPVSLESVIPLVFEEINDRTSSVGNCRRPISTGYAGLDGVLGGWRPGLHILAARPAVGKSAIAVNFALNAILHSHSCLFFSQEMGQRELARRILAIRAHVPLHKITGTSQITDEETELLLERGNTRTPGTLWIDDRSNLSAAEIAATTRQYITKHGVKLIVVDYLQRMRHDKTAGDMYSRQVGETAKALKTLSRDCDIPIFCLAQLNRQNVNRSDPRPMLSDLRDSGEIEQEADTVLLLHPEPQTKDNIRSAYEPISVLIEKQRNGPTGEVKLEYVRPFTEFRTPSIDL